jgi:type IV secretion system protein TrbB
MRSDNMETIVQERERAMLRTAFGPVATLLETPGIVGVQVNADGRVWVAKHGTSETATDYVMEKAERERVIRCVATAAGMECHDRQPSIRTGIFGSRMRFQGYVPPVVDAPCFVVRVPATQVYSLEEYVRDGVCTQAQADALKTAVLAHENIVIAGGIRSGKTTLCNALLAIMSTLGERIITIEVNPELHCTAPNTQALYAVPGVRSMEQLVMDTLASDPRRIVIGEMVDHAAVQVIRAWNTGHPGGLCTVHANGPEETLLRIAQLIPQAIISQPQEEIAQSIDRIAYMEQTETGRRLVSVSAVRAFKQGAYVLEQLA